MESADQDKEDEMTINREMAQAQKTKAASDLLEISREVDYQYFLKSIEKKRILSWKSVLKSTVLKPLYLSSEV